MSRDEIQAAYDRLGYQDGWVFMMTPEQWMHTKSVVMVGLNPGGPPECSNQVWDSPEGNQYFLDNWTDPIKTQIRAVHETLHLGREDVFAAQFIPFRSKSLSALSTLPEAREVSERLWRWITSVSPARLYLCLGSYTAWAIADLIGAKLEPQRFDVSWGKQAIRRFEAPDGRVVVKIPHLSRYKLFTRAPQHVLKARTALLAAAAPS